MLHGALYGSQPSGSQISVRRPRAVAYFTAYFVRGSVFSVFRADNKSHQPPLPFLQPSKNTEITTLYDTSFHYLLKKGKCGKDAQEKLILRCPFFVHGAGAIFTCCFGFSSLHVWYTHFVVFLSCHLGPWTLRGHFVETPEPLARRGPRVRLNPVAGRRDRKT